MAYRYWNPNPVQHETGVGDCSVRAVARALNISWDEAFRLLAEKAFEMGDVVSSDVVWGNVLRDNGFTRHIIPNYCPQCYRVFNFCKDYPNGTYVLKSDGHVATVVNGVLFDSWDSSMQIPIYYWTRKDN